MRVELAQDVTNGAGGFLEFRGGAQAELGHGIHNTPLHGFEAISDVRKRTIENDIHRIVEVCLFRKGSQRQTLDIQHPRFRAKRP